MKLWVLLFCCCLVQQTTPAVAAVAAELTNIPPIDLNRSEITLSRYSMQLNFAYLYKYKYCKYAS